MRRCLVVLMTVVAATLIGLPRASAGDTPAGSIVRGGVYWEAYRDPVSNVVLLDKKTGYHLAQWNL
ncbi:MAG: hypothetical protein JOY55_00130 [Mycobacterium sp.]|nr:hypothetical protein [Mycobacterium sp.]MBV8290233.1 hypothetical protein [Mycobacterium sp.]